MYLLPYPGSAGKEVTMANILLAVGLTLVLLWVLGLITSFTLGGGIHLLLVIGLASMIFWLILGRRKK